MYIRCEFPVYVLLVIDDKYTGKKLHSKSPASYICCYAVMASKSPNRKLVCPHEDCSFAVARVTDYMYVYIVTTVHTLCNERGRVVGRGWNMRWVVLKLTK